MLHKEEKADGIAAPLLQAAELGKGDCDGATIVQSSFNLVKNLVGSGVLALPSGVAAMSGSTNSLTLGCILLSFMAALCGYCFMLLGLLCAALQAESYGNCWSATIGTKTAWIPKLFLIVKTFSGCLAYSMILANAFTDIFASMGAPVWIASRTPSLWLVTVTCLLPLCLLRSLKALAPFSALGTFCTAYIALFMWLRWNDGSYQPDGQYYQEIVEELRPEFDEQFKPSGILILVSISSTAFIAHYNAPKFYWGLANRSQARNCIVVTTSFLAALLLNLLIAGFGFLTFGSASNGMVLNNYASSDPLATVARTSISLSLLCGYPLLFSACLDGLLELLDAGRSQRLRDACTISMLLVVTVLAMIITELGFLLAFVGALLGAAIIYIIPAAMALCAAKMKASSFERSALDKGLYLAVLLLGVVLMVCGCVVTVLKEFTHILS